MQNASKQWTAWKDLQRRGGSTPPTGAPVIPTFPANVPIVAPGIEVRFRALVKQIKAKTDYNESIGAALGIEGSEQIGPDYATLAPVLNLSISGGQVSIDWGWQGYSAFLDQCELQVDRGDSKGFVLLAIDTTPGYTDTQSFPSAPAEWTSRPSIASPTTASANRACREAVRWMGKPVRLSRWANGESME